MFVAMASRLIEEQQRHNAVARAKGSAAGPPAVVDLVQLRWNRLFKIDGSPRVTLDPTAEDSTIHTVFGEITGRKYPIKDSRGLIVHFHGGGWVLGSIYEQDRVVADLARETSCDVISLEYPLAPESSLEQIIAVAAGALKAVIEHNPDQTILIAGESAGAHVALSSVLHIRSQPALYARIAAMSLFYGIYDLSLTPSQRAWGSEFVALSTDWLEWFYTLATPGLSREQRRDPSLSPLYGDLSRMPPTLFTVGQLDPLIDDSMFINARWQAAGNVSQLNVYPQALHGFNHAATGLARHANATAARFLVNNLPLPDGSVRPVADERQ